jgi:hypothetical protein
MRVMRRRRKSSRRRRRIRMESKMGVGEGRG